MALCAGEVECVGQNSESHEAVRLANCQSLLFVLARGSGWGRVWELYEVAHLTDCQSQECCQSVEEVLEVTQSLQFQIYIFFHHGLEESASQHLSFCKFQTTNTCTNN